MDSCLAALFVLGAPALADVAGNDKTTGCGYRLPQEWQASTTHWTGQCNAGVADGLGVLRVYENTNPVAVFYGRMSSGQMAIGVVDTAEGYLAGRFADSMLVKSDDPNASFSAFREATSAAKAASKLFADQGNAASANYYREKAEQLEAQMD
jgi:hypothetical protein